MADSNGEVKKETLEEKHQRQQGQSEKLSEEIGSKDADIAKKREAIEAKRAEIQKMMDDLEKAEEIVEGIVQERDDLKRAKNLNDGKALLTGTLLGIKKAFEPMIQGIKDRIANLQQVRTESKSQIESVNNKNETENTRIDKAYDRQRKASKSGIINLRINLGEDRVKNQTYVTYEKSKMRVRMNALKNYFKALGMNRTEFTKYKEEDLAALETEIETEFNDLAQDNTTVMKKTGRSIMSQAKIEKMEAEIGKGIKDQATVEREQNDQWKQEQTADAKGAIGKFTIKGAHSQNLYEINRGEKIANFGLKARIALARLGAAIGINNRSVDYIDKTARTKADDRMNIKTNNAMDRYKSFGEETVEFENDIIDEHEENKKVRDKNRAQRAQQRADRREARKERREDLIHNTKMNALNVLLGEKDPLQNIKARIKSTLEEMRKNEVAAYAKKTGERATQKEQPKEGPDMIME